MKLEPALRNLIAAVIEESRRNPEFAKKLEVAVGISAKESVLGPVATRRNRRDPAVLDPFVVYSAGEPALRAKLDTLGVEQLKDVVAQFGMDSSKLAMKWKSADRLIELIVATVISRSRKGEAFRGN
jgi:hypothetical protein